MATITDMWYNIANHDLNDPAYLKDLYVTEKQTIAQIAETIGCSAHLVQKKLRKFGLVCRDEFLNVYTGRWHIIAKSGIISIVKPRIKNIKRTTDEIYPRTTSRNSVVFKRILSILILSSGCSLSSR